MTNPHGYQPCTPMARRHGCTCTKFVGVLQWWIDEKCPLHGELVAKGFSVLEPTHD